MLGFLDVRGFAGDRSLPSSTQQQSNVELVYSHVLDRGASKSDKRNGSRPSIEVDPRRTGRFRKDIEGPRVLAINVGGSVGVILDHRAGVFIFFFTD